MKQVLPRPAPCCNVERQSPGRILELQSVGPRARQQGPHRAQARHPPSAERCVQRGAALGVRVQQGSGGGLRQAPQRTLGCPDPQGIVERELRTEPRVDEGEHLLRQVGGVVLAQEDVQGVVPVEVARIDQLADGEVGDREGVPVAALIPENVAPAEDVVKGETDTGSLRLMGWRVATLGVRWQDR